MKISFKRKNPKAIDDLIRQTARLGLKKVHVGVVTDEQHDEAGMSVKELAAIHEYGSISAKIPARPFIKPSMDNNRAEYRKMMAKGAAKALIRRATVEQVLSAVGDQAAFHMRQYVNVSSNFKPLSPLTIAKKGHAKPLIDTRQMQNAIDYEVK